MQVRIVMELIGDDGEEIGREIVAAAKEQAGARRAPELGAR